MSIVLNILGISALAHMFTCTFKVGGGEHLALITFSYLLLVLLSGYWVGWKKSSFMLGGNSIEKKEKVIT